MLLMPSASRIPGTLELITPSNKKFPLWSTQGHQHPHHKSEKSASSLPRLRLYISIFNSSFKNHPALGSRFLMIDALQVRILKATAQVSTSGDIECAL